MTTRDRASYSCPKYRPFKRWSLELDRLGQNAEQEVVFIHYNLGGNTLVVKENNLDWIVNHGIFSGVIKSVLVPGESAIQDITITPTLTLTQNHVVQSVVSTRFHFLLLVSQSSLVASSLDPSLVSSLASTSLITPFNNSTNSIKPIDVSSISLNNSYSLSTTKQNTSKQSATFRKRIIILSKLDHSTDEIRLDCEADECIIDLVQDLVDSTIWLATDRRYYSDMKVTKRLFEVLVDESPIWKILVKKGLFEDALDIVQDESQKKIIASRYADILFSKDEFLKAAKIYSMTDQSLEEVTLKFIKVGEKGRKGFPYLKLIILGLLIYLEAFLNARLKAEDVSQMIMLTSWIIDLLLHDITVGPSTATVSTTTTGSNLQDPESQLKQFIKNYKSHLNPTTVYALLPPLLKKWFASLINDIDTLILCTLEASEWAKTLELIGGQSKPERYYRHARVLIEMVPDQVVTLWIRSPFLNPRLLIPAMLHHETQGGEILTVKYLEHVILYGNEDRVIHNYLLHLYLLVPSPEASILAFLASQPEAFYDVQFALRLCFQHGLRKATMVLYVGLEMQREAVEMALSMEDVEKARAIVQDLDPTSDLATDLWLAIARYLVTMKTYREYVSD